MALVALPGSYVALSGVAPAGGGLPAPMGTQPGSSHLDSALGGASLGVSPTSGYVDSGANVSGNGFAPGPVTLTFNGAPLTCGTGPPTAGSNGSFTCGFTVPALSAANYTINATQLSNATYALANFAILPPTLSVSPLAAQVAAPANATGEGFVPGSKLTLFLGNASIKTCNFGTSLTVQANGSFACDFGVPALPAGSSSLVASDPVNSRSIPFQVLPPYLGLSPSGGVVGTSVQANGTGFAPGAPLTFQFNASTLSCGKHTTATSGGAFACAFSVPPVTSGSYIVSVTDAVNTATQTFHVGPAVIQLNPSAGTVGSLADAVGSGFSPNTTLTMTLGTAGVPGCTAGSMVSTSLGLFNCTFAVPPTPAGVEQVTVAGGFNSAVANFTVQPAIVPSATSGVVNSSLSISGDGFAASAKISLRLGTSSISTCPSTNVTGSFVCTFAVPQSPYGAQVVSASDGVNSATTTFSIRANLTLSAYSGANGTPLQISGTGFVATSTVNVEWNASYTLCSGYPVGASGSFVCGGSTLRVPSGPGGLRAIVAVEQQGLSLSVSVNFTVRPTFGLTPTTGIAENPVNLSGTGFVPSSSYLYCFEATPISCPSGSTSFTALANGSIPSATSLLVPAGLAQGQYYVVVSNTTLLLERSFNVSLAQLTLSTASAVVGSPVELYGSAYLGLTTYSYCLLPAATFNAAASACPAGTGLQFTTSSTGGIPGSTILPIPPTPWGSYLVDISRNNATISYAPISVMAQIALSSPFVDVGTNVTVAGTAFDPGAQISLLWGTTPINCLSGTPTVASNGSFGCVIVVPAEPGGTFTLTAHDGTTAASTALTVVPFLTLSLSSAPAGASVILNGTGFNASAPYSVTWVGSAISCASSIPITNSTGEFSCSFTVPLTSGPGPHLLRASTGSSPASVSLFVLTIPQLAIQGPGASAQGPVGSVVNLTGSGFAPGKAYVLSIGGVVLLTSCLPPSRPATQTTNSTGAFDCYFSLPPEGGGLQSIEASQLVGGITISQNATFTIVPSASFSVASGLPGTIVVVSGAGFFASNHSANFTVTWAGAYVVGGGTTDPNGSIACQFLVPDQAVGTYAVVISDGRNPSVSLNFTVTAPPPAYPRWVVDSAVLIGIIAVILLVVFFVRRSRRTRSGPSRPRPPEPGVASPATAPVLLDESPHPPPGAYGPSTGVPPPYPFPPGGPADGAPWSGSDYADLAERVRTVRVQLLALKKPGKGGDGSAPADRAASADATAESTDASSAEGTPPG